MLQPNMGTSVIHLAVFLVFITSDLVINKATAQCSINITIKDGPVIQVNENQRLLPVTFLRSGNTTPAVNITATTHFDTAKNGTDYVLTSKPIMFGSSVNETTENFEIINNTKLENHIERFFINVTVSSGPVCQPYPSVIIQIIEDDKVTFGFNRDYMTVNENIGNVSMTFYKSPNGVAEISLTVRYFTQGTGNATLNTDYQNVSKYLTFTPLQYSQVAPDAVAIIDNDVVEDTKCFNMSMSATHPNVMIARGATICILNDDKVTIEFRYANMSVDEELGYISVPVVKISGRSAIPISVRMTMKEDYNTAIKNVDYEDRNNHILTFPKDVSEMIFNVTIKNDDLYESTESVFVGIEALDSSTTIIGSKRLIIIRITDRIDNEIHQEKRRQIESEQKRRTALMSYLLYVIIAVLIIMIIIFIILIIMIIKKMRKYRGDKTG